MRLPIPTLKRHKQQQGNMSYLPPEMIEDILLKLPVKSLIRFSCVSKPWLSLITNPRFARMHVNHNLTNNHHHHHSSLILQGNGHIKIAEVGTTHITQSLLDLPKIVSPDKFHIVKGCCHGILCVIQGNDSLVLWNPRIGDYKRLALPESFDGKREVIGFGYDSSIDDYKVVRAPSNILRSTVVDVLTLKSNSWRRVYDDFPFNISHLQEFVCANGGLYWFANDAIRPINMNLYRPKILFFDLIEEKFSEVPLPTGVAKRDIFTSLAILGGCLCMVSGLTLDSHFDLWVMKEDTWVKSVTIPKISGVYTNLCLTPLCFTKDGAILMKLGGNNFISYQPKDNTFRKFTVDGLDSSFEVIVYAESLVSPCASNGTESQYDTLWTNPIQLNQNMATQDVQTAVDKLTNDDDTTESENTVATSTITRDRSRSRKLPRWTYDYVL